LPCSAAIGKDPEIVFEACEFDRSFRHYAPNVAVILNVEADHLDCYPGGLDEIVEAFTGFGVQLPKGGTLIVSADWPAAVRVAERVQSARPDVRVDTFSLEGAGRVCATRIETTRGLPHFRLVIGGADHGEVQLAVPGLHNVANALAAITAAIRIGVAPRDAADAISSFSGVRRRFDVLAEGDLTVVTDYAHHPTAIAAVIEAARERYPDRRLVVCFEPHQASRTRELFDDFTRALSGADRVLLSDIYICRDRDEDVRSVSSEDLALAIREAAPKTEALHVGDLDALGRVAQGIIGPGDVGLFLGAGKIASVASDVAEHCVTHPIHPAGNAAVVPEAEITGPPVLLLRDRLEHLLGGDLGRRMEQNVPLGPYCTFKAGGRARFFAAPTSQDEAIRVVRTLQRRGVPFVPLGGGSNTLFAQDVFDGAVILTRKIRGSRVLGTTIRAAAGASLPGLIRLAERSGLAGLERFAGIPGTVGGAVFGNAGGPPGTATVGELVRRARVLEADGRVVWRTGEELGLRYRASDLKGCLIVAVDLGLKPGCPEKLRRLRLDMSARKGRVQPLEARSAGCTFRNPEGQSAGRLIDELGLKGLSVGGAEVSMVHGNFLVNRGGATARDILGLMDLVRQRVFEAHGICLHPELRLVA
jgi:UDP-N-acetylenolpyruvoylglucosamine reductase